MKHDGVMIILSSPSGAGKTTLVNLLSKLDNFEVSISHTTRQPRQNETPNKDYYFVNDEEAADFIKKKYRISLQTSYDRGYHYYSEWEREAWQ